MIGIALIKKTLVEGHALAAYDVDRPDGGALAVAYRQPCGWAVAAGGGRVVGERLDQRAATRLMLKVAMEAATAQFRRPAMPRLGVAR